MLNVPREQQLKELKTLSDSIDEEITTIFTTLGWTQESLTKNNAEFFECPFNSGHRVPVQSFDEHLSTCEWKAEGYQTSDIPFPESSLPLNAASSIHFCEQLQNEILQNAKKQEPSLNIGSGERLIPRTSDRLITDFTRDERRILYEYVINNTVKPEIGQDIGDIGKLKPEEKGETSFLELLIQERNLKRRRAKHKGVHTNKKSHTEILREVINQQMDILTDYMSTRDRSHSDEKTVDRSRAASINIEEEQSKNSSDISEKPSSHHLSVYSKERNEYSANKYKYRQDKSEERINKDKPNLYTDHSYRHKKERSLDERRDYSKSAYYEKYEKYPENSKDRKRLRHSDRSRSRSHSRDRKSHSKSKHRHKEERHKRKRHKSNDSDSPEKYNKHREHKKKAKDKHRDR